MTTAQIVDDNQLMRLRESGLISENEIALIEGDILLAKNVISEERRIIGKSTDLINENTGNKRVLKG